MLGRTHWRVKSTARFDYVRRRKAGFSVGRDCCSTRAAVRSSEYTWYLEANIARFTVPTCVLLLCIYLVRDKFSIHRFQPASLFCRCSYTGMILYCMYLVYVYVPRSGKYYLVYIYCCSTYTHMHTYVRKRYFKGSTYDVRVSRRDIYGTAAEVFSLVVHYCYSRFSHARTPNK